MQSVNAAALTPAFMTALFGTAAACLAVIVCSIGSWHQPYAGYLLSCGLLYLLGAIGLTVTFHVPRNQALDRVRPGSPDAAGHRNRYVTTWTAANHVRAAAALAAATVLTIALTTHRWPLTRGDPAMTVRSELHDHNQAVQPLRRDTAGLVLGLAMIATG